MSQNQDAARPRRTVPGTQASAQAQTRPPVPGPRVSLRGIVAASALSVGMVAGCHGGSPSGTGVTLPPIHQAPAQKQLNQPLQHIYVIFLENHTYDNLFLAYPNPTGETPTAVGMASNGRAVPIVEPTKGDWSPGDNDFPIAHMDFDGGAMDGFDQDAHQPSSSNPADRFFHADGTDGAYVSFGVTEEVGRRRLGYFWHLADQGVLSDRYFSSELGQSFPNHLYVMAASAGGAISNPDSSGNFEVFDPNTGATTKVSHLGPASIATALPVELENAGLTWTVLQETDNTPVVNVGINAILDLSASVRDIDVIHDLPDFNQRLIETPFLDRRMWEYIEKGWDAHVTFIKPNDVDSMHPGVGDVQTGQDWTRTIVDAIGHSPDWEHSAILITWDDYGGFYDHVAPEQVDQFGRGMRVPLLVVSPFAKKGVVQHEVREHSSIAKFCETIYGLPTMTARDESIDDLMSAFDFTQTPRPYSDFEFLTTGPTAP